MNIIVPIKNSWTEQKIPSHVLYSVAIIQMNIHTSFQIYIYDFLKSLKYQFILFCLSQVQIQGKGINGGFGGV